MDKRTTWWLTGAAVALFLFIVFFERRLPSSEQRTESPPLLGMASNTITALEVTLPNSTNVVRAEKKGREWRLVKPAYQAQQTRLEAAAGALADLRSYDTLSPHEVLIQGQKAFGFDDNNPSFTVETATNRVSFEIGRSTPLTNNVYVRRRDTGEVMVTDGRVLTMLPKSQDEWRSDFFVDLDEVPFDTLRIQSGQRNFEIAKNPTNRLWQITRPVPARADQNRIEALLQKISMGRVQEFVSDGAQDLERYGLQTPALELTLASGTNDLFTMEFGAAPTNQPQVVYARLLGPSNVVKVDAELASALNQPYKAFHDSRLVSFQAPLLDRLLVRGIEDFTLQKQPDGRWRFEDSQRHADPALMRLFVTNLAGLEIVDIAKEVPTQADLKAFGFENPIETYTFAERLTNASGLPTNIVVTEISFGTNTADIIYTRRSDETPIYMTPLAQAYGLPRRAFQIRERNIWSFAPTNVLSLTLINTNGTTQLTRHPALEWAPDPIANAAIEEMVFRLSEAESLQWVARGDERLASFGCEPPGAVLQVRAREGNETATHEIKFGKTTMRGNIYAAAILPGETEYLIFEFPRDLFQQLLPYLPAPK